MHLFLNFIPLCVGGGRGGSKTKFRFTYCISKMTISWNFFSFFKCHLEKCFRVIGFWGIKWRRKYKVYFSFFNLSIFEIKSKNIGYENGRGYGGRDSILWKCIVMILKKIYISKIWTSHPMGEAIERSFLKLLSSNLKRRIVSIIMWT